MNKPKCEILPDGTKEWYLNGKLHREDGPAIEYPDAHKEWCLNDKLHREDGPAIEWSDGSKSWYLNGKGTHPEKLVDIWLERGIFCWYDETNNCLNFGEINEQT